jgi:RNA polymerase sigma factor (sigma-70 family)
MTEMLLPADAEAQTEHDINLRPDDGPQSFSEMRAKIDPGLDNTESLDEVLQNARAFGYVQAETLLDALAEAGYDEGQITNCLEMLEELEVDIIAPEDNEVPRSTEFSVPGNDSSSPVGATLNTLLDQASYRRPPGSAEQRELARRIQNGDKDSRKDARNELVERNLPLVIGPASKKRNQRMEMDDLVGEGILGLTRAAEKYDPDTHNTRFSTYSMLWINQAINRALDTKNRTISEPYGVNQARKTMYWIKSRLEQELQREPSFEEVLSETAFERVDVADAWWPTEANLSLNTPVGEDGEHELIEIKADNNAVQPDEETARAYLSEKLFTAMSDLLETGTLKEEHIKVLVLRFGLFGVREHSISETMEIMDVSAHWCRRLYLTAVKNLAEFPGLREAALDEDEFEKIPEAVPEEHSIKVTYDEDVFMLTPTHYKVMKGMEAGKTYREIADEISVKSTIVKSCGELIRRRLGVTTKEEAAPIISTLSIELPEAA